MALKKRLPRCSILDTKRERSEFDNNIIIQTKLGEGDNVFVHSRDIENIRESEQRFRSGEMSETRMHDGKNGSITNNNFIRAIIRIV